MSHVDEGTLHAYLDGELPPAEARGVEAHVAECPGCRARLEEERALMARAHELLGLAAPPDRATPPFRVGDLRPPARVWWRVPVPLAWAATVVLALGIGMYLGGGSGMRGREQPVAQRAAEVAAPAPAPLSPLAVRPADSAAPAPVDPGRADPFDAARAGHRRNHRRARAGARLFDCNRAPGAAAGSVRPRGRRRHRCSRGGRSPRLSCDTTAARLDAASHRASRGLAGR